MIDKDRNKIQKQEITQRFFSPVYNSMSKNSLLTSRGAPRIRCKDAPRKNKIYGLHRFLFNLCLNFLFIFVIHSSLSSLFILVIQSEAKNLGNIHINIHYTHSNSTAKFQKLGFVLLIKVSFFSLLQPFNSFSRAIASSTSVKHS